MLSRERVIHSLLELTTGSAGLTPVELGGRVLDIALALIDCEGVSLTAPRHRDAIRILNPVVPNLIREEALQAVTKDRSVMDRVRANREVHALIRDGKRIFRAEVDIRDE